MTTEKYQECLKRLRNYRSKPRRQIKRETLELRLNLRIADGTITRDEAEDEFQAFMNR